VPAALVRVCSFAAALDGLGHNLDLDLDLDLVIGSDLTYGHEAHARLASTCAALLRAERPPRVVLAHEHRR
jgi:predicted nicotinamide N-methyase